MNNKNETLMRQEVRDIELYKMGWKHAVSQIEGVAGYCVIFKHPEAARGQIVYAYKSKTAAQKDANGFNDYLAKQV